jgi:hypothetical protein
MTFLRPFLAFVATFLAALSFAGTLTVTSPTEGAFLGKTNTVTFNISGASVQVKVTAVATPVGGSGSPLTFTTNVTPSSEGTASGSISMNFGDSAPQTAYTLVVSASEPNNSYASTTLNVTVDSTAPKFTELSPANGGFFRSILHIRGKVDEANLDTWKVRVNGQDIPNNTGSTDTISVDYDATGVETDGPQSVQITATDKAGNVTTKNISVTLDRIRPTVQIVYPTATTKLAVGALVTILVDISDASSSTVDKTGIDVIAKATDGSYITRATLVSLRATNGTTQRWTGRIRYKKGLLPSRFVISVSVVDRAGNSATLQEVNVKYGR